MTELARCATMLRMDTAPANEPDRPIDGVLLVSFGGPEQPDDVVPFLRSVTRGANIPEERLRQVGEHYFLFGGRSPINDQNRELLSAIETEFAARGHHWPLLWGNRHWHPLLPDTLRAAKQEGRRRLVVLTTAAYPSYSGCRSYREALAEAAADRDDGEGEGFEFLRIGNYALDEGFVQANANAVAAALASVEPGARVVFVTHSIPTAMDDASGPAGQPGTYVAWHQRVAERVCALLGVEDFDLAFCSRSGPPSQPWLEPDVNDHLEALAERGVRSVVLAPIGFTSDHMEVIYDLDTEARQTCDRLGLSMARSATAGVDPAFVRTLVDRIEAAAARRDPTETPPGCGGLGCCSNLREPDREAVH
ncbi:Ferrochelatase [Aestuariimicrobium sp. T2.26MG-19.2B]|nr:Ferrochelatase [Aestuariimicrobium sp. T2.26MG-19.2B]